MKTLQEKIKIRAVEYAAPIESRHTNELCRDAFIDGAAYALELANEWISVEDELPPKNQPFLIKYGRFIELCNEWEDRFSEEPIIAFWKPIDLK